MLVLCVISGLFENQILKNILDEVSAEPLEIVDKRDCLFFVHAMSACLYMYKDLGLAKRVNDLLNKNARNQTLIGNSISESVY